MEIKIRKMTIHDAESLYGLLSDPKVMESDERCFMVDYEQLLKDFCAENGLAISLSYDMPAGYETANGTFDPVISTLFINKEYLNDFPDCEQMFYLYHELRHALQYLCPERFGALIQKSSQYVIMYDGHCYKLVQDEWKECVLDGSTEYFSALYLGQPYEKDANEYAFEKVRSICGRSAALDDLHSFWMPKIQIADSEYEKLYSEIDEKAR